MGRIFLCVTEVSWPGSDPTDQGPPEEGGLGSCAPPLMPLPPGPSRRDGVAVAVLPLASCPHGVWWVPPLPHQGNTNLGILSRTLWPSPGLGCSGEAWRGIQSWAGELD